MPSRRYQDPLAIAVAMALLPQRHCRCRCCSVTSAGAPRRSGKKQFQHTPSSRALYQIEIHQIKNNPIKSSSTSLKTSAVKTSWEKYLLVGKRVPTHACRQDARTCSTKEPFFSLPLLITRTPFASVRPASAQREPVNSQWHFHVDVVSVNPSI